MSRRFSFSIASDINMKEGYLKKKMSLLKGYTDQWFQLSEDGYLKYFNEKPLRGNMKQRGKLLLLLSVTSLKKDLVSFNVTSADDEVYRLRADTFEKRNEWVQAINNIRTAMYNKMFRGVYDTKERQQIVSTSDDENDNKGNKDIVKPMHETVCDEVMAKPEQNTASLFKAPQKSFVAVAAIDFGTTYSGCAFSTVQDFKTNKLRIETIPLDDKNVFSYKTPTVLLLNPEGHFHSFGTTAEDHYVTLAENDEANSWYYFDRFKMQLYSAKEINRNMMLREMGGKKMEAMLVFALCIEYIKDKVLDRLRQAIHGLQDDDVRWVLTVPAIWCEQARQFMIKAAAKAGISKDNLKLALEPEGAAMFCKYLAVDKVEHGDQSDLKAFEEKAQFMVVDLGGGTIDITVSEVLATGQLKEIYNATGGAWGGNYINSQIIKTLKEVIGWEVIRTFRLEELDEYLELLRNVEQRKRGAKHDSELSLAISRDLSKKIKIPDSHKQSVRLSGRSINLSASLMKKIFSSSVNTMTKHVEGLLQKKETREVSTILLVGGFAASNFVQRAFREKFEQKYKIIFPLTPDMIVLKGAVILGHLGEAIVDRMTKYHYGLGLSAAAVSGCRISVEEDKTKTFFSLIKKGQTIKVGDVVTEYEVAIKAKSQWASIEVYTTDEDVPRTIIDEEHFTKVGSINVTLPQFKHESILILTITYCETEFKVIATDKTTGRCFVGICRFLGK